MIYLDYNATAPMLPSVIDAMAQWHAWPLNPSSVHAGGRQAKKLLEESRATIAQALGAFPNEVLFTASATEANNMVLRGFAAERALVVSAIEHPSVGKTASQLGAAVVPVDAAGVIRLDVLESHLKAFNRPALVSVMLANNETGVIQPIAEVARIAHAHGALVHCDAVQALGKIQLDWGLLGVDMLSLCAHKAGGPVGAGALLIRNDLAIKPLMTGGSQELGRRPSTHNIPAIVGFAKVVAETANYPLASQWLQWRDWLEKEIKQAAPEAIIFGEAAPRLPNTLQVAMPGIGNETQLMRFDLAGFALSAGSACSSGRMEASPSLLAMGVAPELAKSAVRVSFGWNSTEADIRAFAACWKTTYQQLAPTRETAVAV